MAGPVRPRQSIETILDFDQRDAQSDWSTIWSTAHIPGMDNATGRGNHKRLSGRRRLSIGALALGGFLSMHCPIVSATLTGGYILFMVFLVGAVAALANPLRHFEVYLGQWSISGPGRAFRMIPMFDGIGIAMCMSTIIRAINCCTVASMAALYVLHSVADAKLPFTYCRTFDLIPYEPDVTNPHMYFDPKDLFRRMNRRDNFIKSVSLNKSKRYSRYKNSRRNMMLIEQLEPVNVLMCTEPNITDQTPMHRTPAYNFFFIEVVQLRPNYNFLQFNITLLVCVTISWLFIWLCIIMEKYLHRRLIWNNVTPWFVIVPWVWTIFVIFIALSNVKDMKKTFRKAFQVGAKEVYYALTDAFEIALYIHSAGTGTEHILGKGLNHYANGHVDPHFNGENVWYSTILLMLTILHTGGGTICSLVDYVKPNINGIYDIDETMLWVLPMYSKCAAVGRYSHLMSALIFSGLVFSYLTVTYYYIKTALHIIFEYRVKLVFTEQLVVGALIITCMACSLLSSSSGGLLLLESVNSIMNGISVPFVTLMELICLIYVYRSRDFMSDMDLSTEDNACSYRINYQWHIIPIIMFILVISKVVAMTQSSTPIMFILIGLVPLVGVVLSIPIRACHNAFVFLRPAPRRGT